MITAKNMSNPQALLLAELAKKADYARVDLTKIHQALRAKNQFFSYGTIRACFDPNSKRRPKEDVRLALADLFGASMEEELALHRSAAP